MEIRQMLVDPSKYSIKCPNQVTLTRIVVHNTANDASANNEVKYMITNNNEVSFHIAVDDIEAVQGIPFNRNAWNAGDGHGKGNMEGLSIEICYSKSGGDRFIKAEQNAAKLIAQLLKERGWGIDKVTKHQDYNGKYCPHRTLDMGWDRFLNMVKAEMNGESVPTDPATPPSKSINELAQEVIAGKWGNGDARKQALTAAGYDADAVQAEVNRILGGGSSTPSKSIDVIADEVIAGEWGNGDERKQRLAAAGYDVNAVQARVNEKLGASSGSSSSTVSIKVGAKVTLSNSATTYATGETIPSRYKGKTYTIQQVGNGKVLLQEIYSWVRTSDLVGVSGGSSSGGTIKKGSKVVVTNPVDVNGTHLAVSGTYDVIEVSGSRVVIGKGSAVTAAININNLRLA